MKSIFASLYGIFIFTAVITHLWTVIIAFGEGGIMGGLLTLFLPFIGELYWMCKMFGVNDTYAFIALIHLGLAILFAMVGRSKGE